MLRMNRYITWPSACAHLAPAVTKASPAAFNIISSDIRMKTMLRRTITPTSPSAKSAVASNNPCSIGTEAITILLLIHLDRADLDDRRQPFPPAAAAKPARHRADKGR